jgi:hypothetical protein
MTFSTKELPCFTVWKNTAAEADGYVTGSRAGDEFPNNRSFERKKRRVPVLQGGESYRASFTVTTHLDQAAVTAARGRVEKLRTGIKTQLEAAPAADLSP